MIKKQLRRPLGISAEGIARYK